MIAQGTNVSKLIEEVLTLAEVLELKCDPTGLAEGTIVESQVVLHLVLRLVQQTIMQMLFLKKKKIEKTTIVVGLKKIRTYSHDM